MWAKVWLPLMLVGATILLGWIGYYDFFQTRAPDGRASIWEAFFWAAGLPLQETAAIEPGDWEHIGPSLHIARVLGLFVIPYAFVLAFLALFGTVLRPLRIRSWRWFAAGREHTIVCGLGWKGYELAHDLMQQQKKVAVVEADPDNPLIRAAHDLGAVVIRGDATHPATLQDAGARRADKIFVACDSDETNVRVLEQIAWLAASQDGRRHPLDCSVEIHDYRTREFVHRMFARGRGLRLSSFDTYETTARQLLDLHPFDRLPGDGNRSEARVVILGHSPMARAILFQALLLGHLPPPRRLRISVLTEDPAGDHAEFLRSFPCFGPEVADSQTGALSRQVLPEVSFSALPASDTLLLAEGETLLRVVSAGTVSSIYACIDDGLRSAAYASAMLPALATAAANHGADVQLLCYYEYPEDEHRALVEESLRDLAPGIPVHAFENFLTGFSVDRVEGRPVDDIARQIAASYREEYGGPGWWEMSEADRISNRRAADHVAVKLRSVGAELVDSEAGDPAFSFSEAEVAMLSEVEHRRWCAEKLLNGWRPLPRTPENRARWQKEKENLKRQKLHFDLVPFSELDEHERGKDRLQILSIPRFVAALGLAIRRWRPYRAPGRLD